MPFTADRDQTQYGISDDSAVESDAASLASDSDDQEWSLPSTSGRRLPQVVGCDSEDGAGFKDSKTVITSKTMRRRPIRRSSSSSKRDRMLMRPWLQQQADQRSIPNMYWYDKSRTRIRIPWKHGSRSGWTLNDCQLYRAWAEHTGKHSQGRTEEPKRWKANFRCALNSLKDVCEVKSLAQTRGKDPFKVYEFLAETPRRKTNRTRRSRNRRSGSIESTSEMSMSSPSSNGDEIFSMPSPTIEEIAVQQAEIEEIPSIEELRREEDETPSYTGVIPTVVQEMDVNDLFDSSWPPVADDNIWTQITLVDTPVLIDEAVDSQLLFDDLISPHITNIPNAVPMFLSEDDWANTFANAQFSSELTRDITGL